LFFQTYTRLRGAGPFQAGTYTMHRKLGARGAVEVLEAGPTVRSVNLAVIPGKRLSEIATEVNKQVPWLDGEKFLRVARSGEVRSKFQPQGSQDLEGLLWPDTYKVAESETEKDVLRTMVRQFDKQATAAGLEEANAQGYGPYDIVKIASLVQSEAKVDKDRPLIASVIYNRLHDDMQLQIDAEVMYGVNKRTPPTRTDLDTPGPYNSYLNKGLPPTPISSVTTASLIAALKPANTPYLYYVIGAPDGSHAFARTFEEHQANIEKARRQGLL